MAIFKFFCDESHDSAAKKSEPKSYLVGGFFADENTWHKIETKWKWRNALEGVPRYHAAHLNAASYEYEGWSRRRRLFYSKEMLSILKSQHRKLHGISVGMDVEAYRRIISPAGQVKMGSPYLTCFKSTIALVAGQMDYANHPKDHQFAAIIDRGDMEAEAVKAFYAMKDDPQFIYRHRLATCTPGSAEEFIGLQPADFVAYETFRLMHDKKKGVTEMRKALNGMLGTTGFLSLHLEEKSLERIKDDVDRLPSVPNGFVIIPPYIED